MSLTENPEAEAALVNALIVDPSQVPTVADLQDGDFSSPAYAHAYRTIVSMVHDNRPVDVLALKQEGVEISAAELAGRHSPATAYAGLIRDAAYRRRMATAVEDIARATETGSPSMIAEAIEQAALMVQNLPMVDSGLGVVNLEAFRFAPPPPLLDILSPEGTTVLFGEGGDGKGWIAAKLAARLIEQGIRVAVLDFENHPNEWVYRLTTFGVSMDKIVYLAPPTTMEKWANDSAAKYLRDLGVQFLIVDSAMYASNVDDPYSPSSALGYKRARSKLGNLPAILLAHTAKGQDSIFGSVFWRNEARVVWRLNKDFLTRTRTLECRKANNYRYLEGVKMTVEFDESAGVLNLHPHGQAWQPQRAVVQSPPQQGFDW